MNDAQSTPSEQGALLTLKETLAPSHQPILGIQQWASNAHLIADCARLGYLRPEWRTLDCTYGYGSFWRVWKPETLIASDLFTNHAATLGLGLVDRFDFLSYRPQPLGPKQVHARRNASQLLIFKRGWSA